MSVVLERFRPFTVQAEELYQQCFLIEIDIWQITRVEFVPNEIFWWIYWNDCISVLLIQPKVIQPKVYVQANIYTKIVSQFFNLIASLYALCEAVSLRWFGRNWGQVSMVLHDLKVQLPLGFHYEAKVRTIAEVSVECSWSSRDLLCLPRGQYSIRVGRWPTGR